MIWRFFFYRVPITYESRFPLGTSIQRLEAVLQGRWSLFQLFPGIYGRVSEESVVLYRVMFFWRNAFAPVYRGQFVVRDDKVILTGVYRTPFQVYFFLCLWFAVNLAGFAMTAYSGKMTNAGLLHFAWPFSILLMVGVGKWLSRNDVQHISREIEKALKSLG